MPNESKLNPTWLNYWIGNSILYLKAKEQKQLLPANKIHNVYLLAINKGKFSVFRLFYLYQYFPDNYFYRTA